MLETVKAYIETLPNKSFPELYQDYVMSAQHKVSEHRLDIDKHRFTSIDNMSSLVAGLNEMTEELKQL